MAWGGGEKRMRWVGKERRKRKFKTKFIPETPLETVCSGDSGVATATHAAAVCK